MQSARAGLWRKMHLFPHSLRFLCWRTSYTVGLGPSTRKLTGRGFLPVPGTVEKEAQLRSLLCSSEHLELGHKLLARNRVSISDQSA